MKILEALKRNKFIAVLFTSASEFGTDNGNLLSAAVSYNLLFSLFPFALAIISILGFFMESSAFQTEVINAIANLIPVARNMIVSTLDGLVSARAAVGALALIGLIWGATSVFDALRRSLNTVWGIEQPQGFFRGQLTNLVMMICAFIAFMAFAWITTFVSFIHETNMQYSAVRFLYSGLFSRLIFAVLSVVLAFLVILLLYKFVPSRRPRWRDIWPGALAAAFGFQLIRFGFLWYVKNFSTYNLVYGPIGTVIALLVFIYFSTWMLLFIAKFTAVRLRPKTNTSGVTLPAPG
ncbi:MAG: YihY/virulence factor BrkB family protein [Dehalococcoidia bacterium]|nr:YihY/virulence factor BrkB family protein [Dehalococcoidia bacterium]MDD5494289.1 YihY/virulence factor BrkB family protein [Dehalococcoidia bacterium]